MLVGLGGEYERAFVPSSPSFQPPLSHNSGALCKPSKDSVFLEYVSYLSCEKSGPLHPLLTPSLLPSISLQVYFWLLLPLV